MKNISLLFMIPILALSVTAVLDETQLDTLDMDTQEVMAGLQDQSEKIDKVQKDLSDHRNQLEEAVHLATDSSTASTDTGELTSGAIIEYRQQLRKKTDTIIVDGKRKEHALNLDGADAREKAAGRLKSIELRVIEGTLYYRLETYLDAKLLGFIDMDMKTETLVDAATGDVQERHPWYKIFFVLQ